LKYLGNFVEYEVKAGYSWRKTLKAETENQYCGVIYDEKVFLVLDALGEIS
jgi:hypothetical protein